MRRLLVIAAAVSSLSSANAGTSYDYDELGRLKGVTYSNGSTVTYNYDPNGNRTQVVQTVPAITGSLSANPTSITQGNSTTLTWASSNATGASIDNGVGSVTPVAGGSLSVSPSSTTTYTLTLTGPAGTQTRQATVTVAPPGFNQTIQVTGTGPVTLRTLANSAGYNGAMNANVTFEVGPGVTISGNAGAPGSISIDSGTWPTGSYAITVNLVVKNGGTVRGGGGNGGAGNGGAGGAGGDAVYARLPMSVTVESGGAIKAGGGGGGGGGFGRQNIGGEWILYGGGGGGGGFPNGSGGAGGSADGGSGSGGNAGSGSGGGSGGAGFAPGKNGGTGGNSAAGSNGLSGYQAGGAGGAAGYAIRKNGHSVGVTNNGTIVGTQG